MAEWRSDVDDHARRRHEERRPGRVGQRRHEDVSGLESGRVVAVDHHPGTSPGDARAAGYALDGLSGSDRLVRDGIAPGPFGHRGWLTDHHERLLDLARVLEDDGPVLDHLTPAGGIVDRLVQLAEGQHSVAVDSREDPTLDHPPTDLVCGHAHLVDVPDAVGLGAFAARQEDLCRLEGCGELPLGLGVPGQEIGYLGAQALPVGDESRMARRGVGIVGREAHPVDRRKGQHRVGLPGRATGLPLVRPPGAEGHQEVVERSSERPSVVVLQVAQAGIQPVEAFFEGGGQRLAGGHLPSERPHRQRRGRRFDIAEAGYEAEDVLGPADRCAHLGDDPGWHRGEEGDEDVLGEQFAESVGDEVFYELDEFVVAHGGEVRATGAQRIHPFPVGENVGEAVGCENPLEGGADALGGFRRGVVGVGLIGWDARLGAEELLVDDLGRESGGTLAEYPAQRGVQVGVAAEDAEEDRVIGVQLLLGERPDADVGVPETQLGHAEAVLVLERQVECAHRHRVGEYLTDVGTGPERIPL